MKKITVLLGILATLVAFGGCDGTTEDASTEVETTVAESSTSDDGIRKAGTISDEYEDLFHTWYSAYDIIAFTDDGEFYLTYDDIGYCIGGTYTVEDGVIKITIDTSTIKDSSITVGDTDYEFEFVDGNLVLTLADDETQSLTYYLDKSVALGLSD